ncbi:MAG: class B sortase [Clostridia bacterium]|nr:class B sortase [Clostridia bacterium]
MQGGEWKGRRKRKTRFRRFPWVRAALIAVSAALALFALVKFIGYGADYLSSRRTADELRKAYQSETPAPEITAAPTEAPATAAPTPARTTPRPTPTPAAVLQSVKYPGNPTLIIGSRFKALRKQNKDIIGWLTLGDLLDEGVTQRDETYYLTHDALGKKNVNGAIFLDSSISLKTRPYAYLLYGHNMKTGAMFGCLRNYENLRSYRANPFITFDTMYEDGRYVIFAVGTVNIVERVRNFVNLFAFLSSDIQERQTAMGALVNASVLSCPIDVRPDDQILLLVTCVDHDNERRIVAARRVRDGEDENELKKLAERSWKKP